MNTDDFSKLNLNKSLVNNLTSLGYLTMTSIQSQSLPLILKGKDVIAQGKTGSGKTAAFGLGILEQLNVKKFRIQSMVLCPTRELAEQVAKEIRLLARGIHNIKILALCGGTPIGPQIGSLEHGAHIIVGTPGRIEDHLRKNTLKLNDLKVLALDEADRMLDMGFQESLDAIIEKTPTKRQTLLFSATYPEKIHSIAERIMISPTIVQAASTHDESSIQQNFYKLDKNIQRTTAIQLILLKYQPSSALIFCNTKLETQDVATELCNHGFRTMALHGDLEQKDRNQTLLKFSNKSISILVATDVAARGLDIDSLDIVINYHVSRELEVHTHRIGRTGRAGKKGLACTLYTEKESYKISKLEDYLGYEIIPSQLPPESLLDKPVYKPLMATLQIDGGKKQKIRAGDILGALTGENGIEGKLVGKINILDNSSYVAIHVDVAKQALKKISEDKLKGRSFRVRRI